MTWRKISNFIQIIQPLKKGVCTMGNLNFQGLLNPFSLIHFHLAHQGSLEPSP